MSDFSTQLTTEAYGDHEFFRRIWWMLLDLDAQLSFLLGRRPHSPPQSKVPYPGNHRLNGKEFRLHNIIIEISLCSMEICHTTCQPQDDSVLESYLLRLQTCHGKLCQLRTEDLDFLQTILEHEFEVLLLSMALRCRIAVAQQARPPLYYGHDPRPTEDECNVIVGLAHHIVKMYTLHKAAAPTFPRLFGAYSACSFLLSGGGNKAEIRNIHKRLQDTLTASHDSPTLNVAATPSMARLESRRGSCASSGQRDERSHSNISENASNVSNQPASCPDSTGQLNWVESTASEQVNRPDYAPRECVPAPMLPMLPNGLQALPSFDQPRIGYAWPTNVYPASVQIACPEAEQHWTPVQQFQNRDIVAQSASQQYARGFMYEPGLGPQGYVHATPAWGFPQWPYSC